LQIEEDSEIESTVNQYINQTGTNSETKKKRKNMKQKQKVEDNLISNKSSDLCNPDDDQVLHLTLIILHYFIYNFLYN
jgi:hypothetical protein